MARKKRLIVGIGGATGAQMGYRLLQVLHEMPDVETHLVITDGARVIFERAADVCRKEGRKVVLVPREMPLNQAHLRNMLQAAQDGYLILPPVLTFYNGCETTMDQVDQVIGKILMQFDIEHDRFHPWEG
jgi:3-polyprenyl-4-hydroxybenzoate decarboxylase